MKIMMVDPSLFSYPYDHELCQALAEDGHEVFLFGRPLRANEALRQGEYQFIPFFHNRSERLGAKGWAKPVAKYSKGFEHLADMGRLVRAARELQPDIIHFQWLPLPRVDLRYIPALRKIAPVFHTVHNSKFLHGSQTSRLQSFDQSGLSDAFDGLIVHLEQTRIQLIEKGTDKDNLHVIPHGPLRLGTEPEQPKEVTRLRSKTLLFFGHLKKYKGLDLLIRAWADLPEGIRAEWQLVVAGDGPERASIGTLLKDLNLVDSPSFFWINRFTRDSEIRWLSQQASAFVFPYREIDASGVFMALEEFRKPIFASRRGIFLDSLNTEFSDCLFEPKAEEISRVLIDQLSDADRFGQLENRFKAAPTWAASWSKNAHDTVHAYQTINPKGRGL